LALSAKNSLQEFLSFLKSNGLMLFEIGKMLGLDF
jgi:hypothetical protein